MSTAPARAESSEMSLELPGLSALGANRGRRRIPGRLGRALAGDDHDPFARGACVAEGGPVVEAYIGQRQPDAPALVNGRAMARARRALARAAALAGGP